MGKILNNFLNGNCIYTIYVQEISQSQIITFIDRKTQVQRVTSFKRIKNNWASQKFLHNICKYQQ